MILVVGGVASGKREFVSRTFGYSGEQITSAHIDNKPVIYDVQELLRNERSESVLTSLLQKQVVICNEVGSGIVPMEESERQWREEVGRLCCRLAEQAMTVVRVCCGIPHVIKGQIERNGE